MGYTQNFHTLQKQSAEHSDPLYRLFFREGSIGSKLLSQVRRDLGDVVKVCEGALKQTNHLRTLMSSLTKGTFNPSYTQRDPAHRLGRHHPHALAPVQGAQGDGRV